MANIISNDNVSCDIYLQMSNGATSVFISILSMATSKLVERESEKLLSVCIASCDQSVFGIGCTGFDISNLPWSIEIEEFKKDKKFLLKSIDRSLNKKDWHLLDYTPHEENTLENLTAFHKMIESFEYQNRKEFKKENFLIPEKLEDKCEIHGVILHLEGCVVCRDR